jgi:hypothetical protein
LGRSRFQQGEANLTGVVNNIQVSEFPTPLPQSLRGCTFRENMVRTN